MPKIARAHHFVPASMLRGFTPTGAKDDKLWAFDLVLKKEWRTSPKNVAHRRDLYLIEAPGVAPDILEQRFLAPIEGQAIEIIRQMEQRCSVPSDPDALGIMLYFIALLTTRVPLARFMVDEVVDQVNRKKLSELLATPESWGKVLDEMKAMGISTTGMGYVEMDKSLPGFQFKATQHFQLRMMLESAADLMPSLMNRNWGIAESSSGRFICSDRPVVLTYGTPPPYSSYPGFALPNTDVLVPLTKHILLRGTWPNRPAPSGQLKYKGIARVNKTTLDNSDRYAFSATRDFPWMDAHHRIRNGTNDLPRKSSKPVMLRKG